MKHGTTNDWKAIVDSHKVAAQRARAATLGTSRARIAAAMSEAKLDDNVVGMIAAFGLYSFHPHRSDRADEAGWLDRTIIGLHDTGAIYRELKTEKGKLTNGQATMIMKLWDAGLDADVWRPTDWLSGRIEAELRVLAPRVGALDSIRFPQLTEQPAWGEW